MNTEAELLELFQSEVLPWQNSTVNQLVELKQQKKLPHALLIEMRTSADSQAFGWYLAKALLCQTETSAEPCDECKACQLMRANNYPDFSYTTLMENDKTHKLNKDIKIEQVRKLIHQISLTNSLQGGKVSLIYPAEKMNISASNSLLKTLEEPSAESTLILLTHHASRLPITIRSRCQKWVINNPGLETAQTWLKQQGMESDEIEQYLQLAHQDVQLALQLYQQNYLADHQQFMTGLDDYFADNIDVTTLVHSLKDPHPAQVRQYIKSFVKEKLHETLDQKMSSELKQQLAELIELQTQAQKVLQTEDNNLNLLLQLEDVLISIKQIIKRG